MPLTQPLASITYSVKPATIHDLPDLTEIMISAMSFDKFWTGMKGNITYEEEYKFTYDRLLPNFLHGEETGAYECWKVVDESGKILAWAGLGKPVSLTEELKMRMKGEYQFPSRRNQALFEFFQARILPSVAKAGVDPAKDFRRANLMVRREYQRQGLGRLLTKKLNKITDAADEATYVRARPGAAGLCIQMGFETLERVDFDLGAYGVEGGKTSVFVMRREAGAREQRGKKLDWN